MFNIPLEIYNVNKKLSRSVQKKPWFYAFSVSLLSLLLILVIITDFFIGSGNITSFWGIVFMVVLFDVVAIILRFQSRSFIEPYQLALFSINKWKKFLFHIAIFLMDSKSLIYLSVMMCFMLLFLKHSLYLAAILSIFFWSLLLIIVLTWTAAIYGLFGRYLDKIESKIHYLGLFFVAILLGLQQFDSDFFEELPVIKQTGNALYGLWVSSPELVWNNLLVLLGSLALPLLLLFGILRLNRSL